MYFLETNRTQIYRKYSPSRGSGERGVGLNTDGHGFARKFLETNLTQIYCKYSPSRCSREDAKGGKKIYFKIYGRFVSKYLLPIRGNP